MMGNFEMKILMNLLEDFALFLNLYLSINSIVLKPFFNY